MDKRVWPKPEEFIPERFDGTSKIHPFAWLPFGGGPRGCPGKRASISVGKVILGTILHNYDVLPQISNAAMKVHTKKFTSWCRDGVRVKLVKRQSE